MTFQTCMTISTVEHKSYHSLGKKALRHFSKYLFIFHIRQTDVWNDMRGVNNEDILILGWTIPLKAAVLELHAGDRCSWILKTCVNWWDSAKAQFLSHMECKCFSSILLLEIRLPVEFSFTSNKHLNQLIMVFQLIRKLQAGVLELNSAGK